MRLMHLMLAALCLAAFAAFPGSVQARSAPLVDPDPVAIPAGVDSAKVAKDIKRALMGRGWSVTAEQPGQIDSTLNLRTHVARIRVSYDNYLGWIGYLTADLSTNLQLSGQD
ncbi:hypothetical protein [Lysobacter sp. CA199]|uniref:hypothetical protein n=1 Tax=Lysobacter sp. CA199 TaxID=3455608 RepID=UPI003F8D1CFE